MLELVSHMLGIAKDHLATKINKLNFKYKTLFYDDVIYDQIEEMMIKIKKQIDRDNESIKKIQELKDKLNKSQETMVDRVNKLTELEDKMKELF